MSLPRPDAPIAVIGDIHGRADLLEDIIDQLSRQGQAGRMRLIFAGDMIDRGPESGTVLRRLFGLSARPGPFAMVQCLMGNHERMMLDFLADPAQNGARWLASGGDITLASLGLEPHNRGEAAQTAETRLQALAASLAAELGSALISWLSDCPLYWREGSLAVCHAGADPAQPVEGQTEETLLWGHSDFRKRLRKDGAWIAHGHFIVSQPQAEKGCIAVDTGAWRSGRLTAAILDGDGLRFLQSGAGTAA
ncbi:MAG: metallophosphoesterase [Pseudorhodobacter sp.]